MATGSDRVLIEETGELQRYISGVIASEPSFLVQKQEFQDTDMGEADVKQTARLVPSRVARKAGQGRELESELPPPRVQSTPILVEETRS